MQTNVQVGVDAIINLGTQLISLANAPDMLSLEEELPVYTQQIEQFFFGLDKQKLTSTEIERLEQIMENHKKIVTVISGIKKKTSNNIKQLHTGKKMQRTYPKEV